jgi:hypothetical protein
VSELGGNVGLRIEWFAPGQTYPVNLGLDREAHRVRDRSWSAWMPSLATSCGRTSRTAGMDQIVLVRR